MSKVLAPVSSVEIPAVCIKAMQGAIEAEQKNYGAKIKFAATINDLAPADCVWYNLEGNGQKLPPVIKAIKDKYYEGLKAINYSNPSNAWRMIKQYAKEDAGSRAMFGELPPEPKAKGESQAVEGEKREHKSPQLRLVEDLTTLHEYCARMTAKNHPDFLAKHATCHGHIVQALKSLGVDIGL